MLTAGCCFIDGGRSAHESPVLVTVVVETSMVYARFCTRIVADPNILEVLMEVKTVQRELAARRPEAKLENSPEYLSATDGMVDNAC